MYVCVCTHTCVYKSLNRMCERVGFVSMGVEHVMMTMMSFICSFRNKNDVESMGVEHVC
jgi:hypothetical protein